MKLSATSSKKMSAESAAKISVSPPSGRRKGRSNQVCENTAANSTTVPMLSAIKSARRCERLSGEVGTIRRPAASRVHPAIGGRCRSLYGFSRFPFALVYQRSRAVRRQEGLQRAAFTVRCVLVAMILAYVHQQSVHLVIALRQI